MRSRQGAEGQFVRDPEASDSFTLAQLYRVFEKADATETMLQRSGHWEKIRDSSAAWSGSSPTRVCTYPC